MSDEIWRVVRISPNYEVSNIGRVRSRPGLRRKGGVLKPNTCSGYERVTIYGGNSKKRKAYTVHRLVADAFIGIPPGLTVNHKDGDKLNNHISNLEVITAADNTRHRYHTLGHTGPNKLTLEQRLDVARRYRFKKNYYSNSKDLAAEFSVSTDTIVIVARLYRQALAEVNND